MEKGALSGEPEVGLARGERRNVATKASDVAATVKKEEKISRTGVQRDEFFEDEDSRNGGSEEEKDELQDENEDENETSDE